IITIDEADDQLTNLDPAPVLLPPPNATETTSPSDHLSVPSAILESMSAVASDSGGLDLTGTVGTAAYTGTRSTGETVSATEKASTLPTRTLTATALKERSMASPGFTKRIVHGGIQEHHGRLFKYHQVAARAWRGVSLDQWNENIHKRIIRDHTVTPLRRHDQPARLHPRAIGPVGGISPKYSRHSITPHEFNPLEKKSIPPSKCNLVRTCMIDSGDNDGFGITNAGPALLSAIDSLNGAGDHWQFLEHPFVLDVVDGSGQSQGYIY
ncbi:MAG: hypothetical protein Q9225_005034, partial [Loekoesia sp. 1 TL-2023]